jgi:hypothetical protein
VSCLGTLLGRLGKIIAHGSVYREFNQWKSKELVHNLPPKDRRSGSSAPCELIRFFRHLTGICSRRQRNFRAGRPNGMAHASARSDPHSHGRMRLGPARRRTDRGNSSGRCGLVLARRETLARGCTDDSHDTHCHSREERRQGCRLDGARQRRTILCR